VSDFAYNWVVPRQQSASGYVGVDRVCALIQRHKEEGHEFHYARQVRTYLAGTSSQGSAAEHDLARALAHFSTTPKVKHLETVVRLKARLMASGERDQERRAAASAMVSVRRCLSLPPIVTSLRREKVPLRHLEGPRQSFSPRRERPQQAMLHPGNIGRVNAC
jgi:hypothetical protein